MNVASILFSLLPFEYFVNINPNDLETVWVGIHNELPED